MSNAFYDYLFNHVPDYEASLMADWAPTKPSLHPEPIDVRLLPNRLRRVYTCTGNDDRAVAKHLGLTRRAFWKLRGEVENLLLARLKQWLRSLSKERRRKERKLRWHDGSWMGRISVAPWDVDFVNPPNLQERWREVRVLS